MSKFEDCYQAWLEYHLSRRSGERLRRLKEGHGYGERLLVEKVWWPAIGNLDHLHPEYEVYDYKDGSRFLDLAYILEPVMLDLEYLGYGPHMRHASRDKFKDDQRRQRHLVMGGWIPFHFTHDEVHENPRACQQELLQLMGLLFSSSGGERSSVTAEERDLLRYAARAGRPVSMVEVIASLGKSYYLVRKVMESLLRKKLIHPHSGSERIRTYVLDKEAYRFLF